MIDLLLINVNIVFETLKVGNIFNEKFSKHFGYFYFV